MEENREFIREIVKEYIGREGKIEFYTKVVGTTFIQNGQNILKYLSTVNFKDIILFYEREPDNPHDECAVKVIVGVKWSAKTYFIGYVSKDYSELVSNVLKSEFFGLDTYDIRILGDKDTRYYGMSFRFRLYKR
jgi:hypothetical protein